MKSKQSLAQIAVDNGRLCVNGFETENQDIVSYFSELDEPSLQERFETSLKIGVISLRTVGLTERVDYIQKEFNTLNERFNETVDGTVTAIQQNLEQFFGENGQISEVIKTHFGEDGKLVKEIFDPFREGTPMCELRNIILNEIQKLRQDFKIVQAEKDVIGKTALKGFAFEDYFEKLLSKIARQQGDILERTSDRVGKVKLSKKGDFLITIGTKTSRKIVFELKDARSLSVPEIRRTLEESIQNREAQYGVLVARSVSSLPQSIGWFNEYNGNQLVCAMSGDDSENEEIHEEMVRIAYKWAKSKVLLEAEKQGKHDPQFVNQTVDSIREKVSQFRAILTQCTNIQSSADEIRKLVKNVQREINMELSSLISVLKGDD
jgi:hypothetical protein